MGTDGVERLQKGLYYEVVCSSDDEIRDLPFQEESYEDSWQNGQPQAVGLSKALTLGTPCLRQG